MQLRRTLHLAAVLSIAAVLVGCAAELPGTSSSKRATGVAADTPAVSRQPAFSPSLRPRPPPKRVTMPEEERAYVVQLIRQAVRAVESGELLREVHPYFGSGHFFYPKHPGREPQLMLSFGVENFPLKNVDVNFNRASRAAPWGVAISVVPRNFPGSAFVNNLPVEMLDGYRFIRSYEETSEYGSVTKVHVHEYVKENGLHRFELVIKSHAELSRRSDTAPSNFFVLRLTRD